MPLSATRGTRHCEPTATKPTCSIGDVRVDLLRISEAVLAEQAVINSTHQSLHDDHRRALWIWRNSAHEDELKQAFGALLVASEGVARAVKWCDTVARQMFAYWAAI